MPFRLLGVMQALKMSKYRLSDYTSSREMTFPKQSVIFIHDLCDTTKKVHPKFSFCGIIQIFHHLKYNYITFLKVFQYFYKNLVKKAEKLLTNFSNYVIITIFR